jgi:hypothetical protein
MTAFWRGFEKRAGATSGLTGGSGHTGAGKGNLGTAEERRQISGAEGAYGRAEGEDTRTDKTLLDRDRGPRTEDPFSRGPEFQDETNPHIRY